MHPIAANLLVSKLAAPAILAGTLALAAGGAAALSPDNDRDWHHGCQYATTQAGQDAQATTLVVSCWSWPDRDGDGR
jgi:hypothetical protein